jgi:hypothetical protein
MCRLICSAAALARMCPTFDLSCEENAGDGNGKGVFAQAELLKLQNSGPFPDEPRIKGAQTHSGGGPRY